MIHQIFQMETRSKVIKKKFPLLHLPSSTLLEISAAQFFLINILAAVLRAEQFYAALAPSKNIIVALARLLPCYCVFKVYDSHV
jgi:hypothetical protein